MIGIGEGRGRNNWPDRHGYGPDWISEAIIQSKESNSRYRRWREAARFSPPKPATVGFPYFRRGRA
jgi:hypothetical protein